MALTRRNSTSGGLLDGLAAAAAQQFTGTVAVTSKPAGQSGRLHLTNGAITGIHVDGFRPRIARRLYTAGALTDTSYQQLLTVADGDETHPEIPRLVVQYQWVTPDVVSVVLQEVLLSCLAAMRDWPDVKTRMKRDKGPWSVTVAPIPVSTVGAALTRRDEYAIDVWNRIGAGMPVHAAILNPTGDPHRNLPDMPGAWIFVQHVDQARTIDQIAGECGFTRFEAIHMTATLIDAGLVEIARPGQVQQVEQLVASPPVGAPGFLTVDDFAGASDDELIGDDDITPITTYTQGWIPADEIDVMVIDPATPSEPATTPPVIDPELPTATVEDEDQQVAAPEVALPVVPPGQDGIGDDPTTPNNEDSSPDSEHAISTATPEAMIEEPPTEPAALNNQVNDHHQITDIVTNDNVIDVTPDAPPEPDLDIQLRLTELNSLIPAAEQESAAAAATQRRLRDALVDAQTVHATALAEVHAAQAGYDTATTALTELANAVAAAANETAAATDHRTTTENTITTLAAEHDSDQQALQQQTAALTDTETELEILTQQIEELTARRDALAEHLNEDRNALTQLADTVASRQQRLARLNDTLTAAITRLDTARDTEATLNEQLADARRDEPAVHAHALASRAEQTALARLEAAQRDSQDAETAAETTAEHLQALLAEKRQLELLTLHGQYSG